MARVYKRKPVKDLPAWAIALRAKHERRRAARAALVARRARIARGERAPRPLVELVPGRSGWVPPARAPGRHRLNRDVLLMVAAGWRKTRIAREFGVTVSAVWRWLKRRRLGPVEPRRPVWIWGQCSTCRRWGWFYQTGYRRKHGGRRFCSIGCYRARGRKPRKSPPPLTALQPAGATIGAGPHPNPKP